MATSNAKPKIILYIIGEARYINETVYEDDNTIITPSSATAVLVDDAGLNLATLTVTKSAGLVETTIPSGEIAIPGNYTVEWDITYTKNSITSVKTIITEVIAKYPDSSYLYTLVSQMRTLVNDNPRDPNKRIASNSQLKEYLVSAVRYYGSPLGYEIATTLGVVDIDPLPISESADEKILVLWGAYLYITLCIEAIAREQTTLFSIAYDNAYSQLLSRADLLMDRLKELDPSATLAITGETDISAWGQAVSRQEAETNTWI